MRGEGGEVRNTTDTASNKALIKALSVKVKVRLFFLTDLISPTDTKHGMWRHR